MSSHDRQGMAHLRLILRLYSQHSKATASTELLLSKLVTVMLAKLYNARHSKRGSVSYMVLALTKAMYSALHFQRLLQAGSPLHEQIIAKQ